MNATAQLTQPQDATHDNAAVPILMRLPDLREIVTPVVEPAPIPTPSSVAREVTSEVKDAVADVQATPVAENVKTTEPAIAASSTIDNEIVATKDKENVNNEQPATPATNTVARRDRAQERMRRQKVEPERKSWWSSHAPTILIVFLVALGITFYMARQKSQENRPAPETWANSETPELNIETATSPETLPVIETTPPVSKSIAETTKPELPATETILPKREVKTPPLLTADASPKTEDKPVLEEKPKTAVTNAATAPTYPTTADSDYRPAGRVTLLPEKTGTETPVTNVPSYPVTNFPSTWR